jgi:hypothetical protein
VKDKNRVEDLFTQWVNGWISPSHSSQRVNQHFSVSNDFSGIKDPLQGLGKAGLVADFALIDLETAVELISRKDAKTQSKRGRTGVKGEG